MESRRKLMASQLKRNDWDLFLEVFYTTDRVQHMMYRLFDENHPLYNKNLADRWVSFFGKQIRLRESILEVYKVMDNTIGEILEAIEAQGWSADNLAFGSGGGLLQKLNRDTCKFAFKCASATVDGVAREVFKEPVTDPGKKSKRGRLRLVRSNGGEYSTIENATDDSQPDVLDEVFRDGELLQDWSFDSIRERAQLH